jgi:hypothetical protein
MKLKIATLAAALTSAASTHANISEYCSSVIEHKEPTQTQWDAINKVFKWARDNHRYNINGSDYTTVIVGGAEGFIIPLFTCDLTVKDAMAVAATKPPAYMMEINLAIEAMEAAIGIAP